MEKNGISPEEREKELADQADKEMVDPK